MRQARIKIPAQESEAAYHCVTRTVNKERLFDDRAEEVLRRQLWQVADYCGVKIVTYSIMSNHFHVLIRIPRKEALSDLELLRRYRVLYPTATAYQTARLEVIQVELAKNSSEAVAWRRRQLALMSDVSQFMKLLKQRFSIWFNKTHRRVGTLWAERFKSVLVESKERVLQTIAAYIDLNCVRAGLVVDPKDYRFCGYAEAVAGNAAAQEGIQSVRATDDWWNAQSEYREVLFGTATSPRESAASIPAADYERVLARGGNLPLAAVLRCRIRYFTDGAVLGSRTFVERQLLRCRQMTGRSKSAEPRALPEGVDWGGLMTLRKLRRQPIG